MQSDCGAVIASYCPSASVLMRHCVFIWQLTLIPFADASGQVIAHRAIT